MRYSYYQQTPFSYRWYGAIKWLIIVNVAVFAIELLAGPTFIYTFGLVPYLVTKNFFLWQIATYMFLHGGFFHLFINLFILWMFGKEIEDRWGTAQFLKYYFICGLGSGVFITLTGFNSTIPTIGASGAIYGILVAFAVLYPDRPIYLYFFIPMKAKHFALLVGVFSFLAGASGSKGGISHLGHLGGLLVGYIYLKFPELKYRFQTLNFPSGFRFPKIKKSFRKYKNPKEEVNRILDKILIHGVDSLTSEEKEFMEKYSTKH
ncbi:MAG: rhomboid family intramembrane serine protease [Elusimicrobia bacterium]|nr:rhomboid family intramembrane serine protease [Elusimicrobiota bacterium]